MTVWSDTAHDKRHAESLTRPCAAPPPARHSETVNTSPAIRLSGLRKTFGSLTAVDGVDLTVNAGEVIALLGPNGAGKSTTIDLALGLARPTAGTAELFGGDPRAAIREGRSVRCCRAARCSPP